MPRTKLEDAVAKAAQEKLRAMDKPKTPKVEVEIEEGESEDEPKGESKGLSALFMALADLLKD